MITEVQGLLEICSAIRVRVERKEFRRESWFAPEFL